MGRVRRSGRVRNADENRVQTDLGDVAIEVEVAETSNEHMEAQPEIPRHTEPEIIQNEAPTRFRPGIFSCACAPCEPAQGDPALVSALPSDQVPMQLVVQPATPQPSV